MRAYVWASGLIEFGRSVPDGAIPLASGPSKALREFMCSVARHGYKTHNHNGKPIKIPGSDCLLVPGIPEATTQHAAGDALFAFKDWIRLNAKKAGISV